MEATVHTAAEAEYDNPAYEAPTPVEEAAVDTAAAALAEVDDGPRTVTWRDVELELPPELPATIMFDLTELELAGQSPMPVFRLLRSILGQEQFTRVRNTVERDRHSEEENLATLTDLMDSVFESFGIGLGE